MPNKELMASLSTFAPELELTPLLAVLESLLRIVGLVVDLEGIFKGEGVADEGMRESCAFAILLFVGE